MLKQLKHILKKILYFFLALPYGAFGENSKICRPITLISHRKHIFIGKNVFIRKYARIEPIVFWHEKKYSPEIIIGDRVSIEQNLHLTCAQKVEIENDTVISSYVCISDIDHEYEDITKSITQQGLLIKPTKIKKNCFIGTGVKITGGGITIGEHSVIGANAVVTHDIPPYCVAAGVPARVIKKYNFEKKQWEKIK